MHKVLYIVNPQLSGLFSGTTTVALKGRARTSEHSRSLSCCWAKASVGARCPKITFVRSHARMDMPVSGYRLRRLADERDLGPFGLRSEGWELPCRSSEH